jgi:AcrR family transcriptional regulator
MKRQAAEPARRAPAKTQAKPATRGSARAAEILAAARLVFIERGYAGASTDAIVARCGGSKETIYAHFGSKLGLFRAVLLEQLDRTFPTPDAAHAASPEELLRAVGRTFVYSLDDDTFRLARNLVSEIDRIPDVAKQLYEAGDERLAREVAEALRAFQARGAFPPADTLTLARIFIDLLGGRTMLHRLFEPTFRPSHAELEATVDLCVETVLRLAQPTAGKAPLSAPVDAS